MRNPLRRLVVRLYGHDQRRMEHEVKEQRERIDRRAEEREKAVKRAADDMAIDVLRRKP